MFLSSGNRPSYWVLHHLTSSLILLLHGPYIELHHHPASERFCSQNAAEGDSCQWIHVVGAAEIQVKAIC